MRTFILILLAFTLAACGGTASQSPSNPPVSVPVQTNYTIDTIEVNVAESNPPQVVVHLQGYLNDGCSSLGEIKQERDGNIITLHINTNHTGSDICPSIAPQINERITLDGEFKSGNYVVKVNNIEKNFNL